MVCMAKERPDRDQSAHACVHMCAANRFVRHTKKPRTPRLCRTFVACCTTTAADDVETDIVVWWKKEPKKEYACGCSSRRWLRNSRTTAKTPCGSSIIHWLCAWIISQIVLQRRHYIVFSVWARFPQIPTVPSMSRDKPISSIYAPGNEHTHRRIHMHHSRAAVWRRVPQASTFPAWCYRVVVGLCVLSH